MGSLKKIYIVHGWTYSTDKWLPAVEKLKKDGFETVLLNVPGLTKEIEKPWTLNDYVEWLHQELKDQKDVVLLGHSNGGRIAISYALKYPELISNLILVDSAGVLDKRLKTNIKKSIFGYLSKCGKLICNSDVCKKFLYKLAGEKDYLNATPVMRSTMANLITVDLEPELCNIAVPTLIIWGEKDKATPLYQGQIMNQNIKKSKLVIIENAGHSPHFTNPEKIVELVEKEIN